MTWYKKASSDKNKSIAPIFESAGRSQKSWNTTLGDYQRWVVDAYEVSVYITETDYKIVVSMAINKIHLGTIMLQMFWKYTKEERSKADKTYKEVCTAVSKIFAELANEEAPSALYESMIRHDCMKIDNEHIARTNNPIINYSYNVVQERDWRSSIYGNRYPKPGEYNEF